MHKICVDPVVSCYYGLWSRPYKGRKGKVGSVFLSYVSVLYRERKNVTKIVPFYCGMQLCPPNSSALLPSNSYSTICTSLQHSIIPTNSASHMDNFKHDFYNLWMVLVVFFLTIKY